ncbi:hypothetical protein EVG20_g8308 [Dentipellis fragilis]|uniref:Pyrimidine 5-nucleotidase n=1 Tax=Dentipellis fragilis TaxID=205917 RepID=A0A4Y9YB02_9AGAM|nr:hypothetical protein EVG20_g8308 [Dentipellis fragilis]
MIKPDPALRQLFLDINRAKVRVWALTNAYRPSAYQHAERVLRILNLDDQVEGVIYCDYAKPNFVCKPELQFYLDAMEKANVQDPEKCFFVDDNQGNIDGARKLGWGRCVHFCESGLEAMEGGKIKKLGEAHAEGYVQGDTNVAVISNLQQLRDVWSDIFEK